MSELLRELFMENPMLDEVSRARRKLMRGGVERPVVNYVIIGLVAFCYLWLLADIVRYREDFASALLWVGLILVTLVVPAATFGAIAGERERATWDALILTRLTPGQIVAGKLVWRIVLVAVILLVLTIPGALSRVAAMSTRLDDVTNGILLLGLLQVFLWGVFLSAFGLWVSSISRRSITALAVIAGSMLILLALVPVLFQILWTSIAGYNGDDFADQSGIGFIFHLNPFMALTYLLNPPDGNVDLSLSDRALLWGWVPNLAFIIGAACFILLTHMHLKRLEEPRRRTG